MQEDSLTLYQWLQWVSTFRWRGFDIVCGSDQQADAVDVFQKANCWTTMQMLSVTATNKEHMLTEISTICFSF